MHKKYRKIIEKLYNIVQSHTRHVSDYYFNKQKKIYHDPIYTHTHQTCFAISIINSLQTLDTTYITKCIISRGPLFTRYNQVRA